MQDLKVIINNINNLRNEQNLSIEKLANLSNIPVSTLSKYLAGITTDPHISLLIKLSKTLNCSIDDFLKNDNVVKFKKLKAIAFEEGIIDVEVDVDKLEKLLNEKG